ncbi:hypothetical protein ACKS0A_04426 [Histoplasma ohiense]
MSKIRASTASSRAILRRHMKTPLNFSRLSIQVRLHNSSDPLALLKARRGPRNGTNFSSPCQILMVFSAIFQISRAPNSRNLNATSWRRKKKKKKDPEPEPEP